eukprot:43600-Pyramimonas_sp.AAC.1
MEKVKCKMGKAPRDMCSDVASDAATTVQMGMGPKSKAAAQSIRRAHAACDKAIREWGAAVTKSSSHENTKGC